MNRSAIRVGVLATGLCVLLGSARAQVSMGSNYQESRPDGDEIQYVLSQGVWYEFGGRRIRAESMVVRMDRDEYRRLTESKGQGLPRRGTFLPGARRTLTAELIAHRLESFLKSMGSPRPATAEHRDKMLLFRSIYLEGNVAIIDSGVEVLTAKSLLFSVPDNRVVLKGAEMRLVSKSPSRGETTLVLRAPKLVKQGLRTTGRNVSLTTCTAGVPHFEVLSDGIEIIERGDQFEIFSRGNNFSLAGRRTVPLPNAHFFANEQNDLPIKGARARYSNNLGTELGVDFGASWNDTGGAIHHFLTGRPANEFRGEWLLGVGYIEKRGLPIDGELEYGAKGLYQGRTRGFFLDHDRGPNRNFIRNRQDGTLIDDTQRQLILSENRVELADNWRLDITAYSASDAAVYPEFYLNEYLEAETPETSLHLRHADDNRLFTVTGRTNLASHSYTDSRSLAPSFKEELPLATYDVFSEPLAKLGDTDLVLTSSTSAGVLEHEFDPRFLATQPPTRSDRTLRVDQDLELAAPFHLGPFAVRPRASGRYTYYDNTVRQSDYERWALDAGVSVTTRFARTFSTTDRDGNAQTIRHSIYPSVSVGHMYQVDGRPTDFFQFDEVDSLNENGVIRVGLLNRFQQTSGSRARSRYRNPFDSRQSSRTDSPDGLSSLSSLSSLDKTDEPIQPSKTREFLFLDLAQSFFPIAGRDNGGHALGLSEYELIWRPHPEWIPIENLAFLVEGEHDWRNHRVRTFNAVARMGEVLGFNWQAGYRTDYLVDGALLYGLSRNLFGRWTLMANGAHDLQTNKQLFYATTLVRRDHDWVITMGLTFNIIQNDTTFRIDFEPLFGSRTRRHSDEFEGMAGRGSDAMLNY